jgi:hypothetical protein
MSKHSITQAREIILRARSIYHLLIPRPLNAYPVPSSSLLSSDIIVTSTHSLKSILLGGVALGEHQNQTVVFHPSQLAIGSSELRHSDSSLSGLFSCCCPLLSPLPSSAAFPPLDWPRQWHHHAASVPIPACCGKPLGPRESQRPCHAPATSRSRL